MQFYTFATFILLISVSNALLTTAGVFPSTLSQPENSAIFTDINQQTENANIGTGGQFEPGTQESFTAALGTLGSAFTIFGATLVSTAAIAPFLTGYGVPAAIAFLLAIPVWFVYLMTAIQFIKPFKQFR